MSALAREIGISPSQLFGWRADALKRGEVGRPEDRRDDGRDHCGVEPEFRWKPRYRGEGHTCGKTVAGLVSPRQNRPYTNRPGF